MRGPVKNETQPPTHLPPAPTKTKELPKRKEFQKEKQRSETQNFDKKTNRNGISRPCFPVECAETPK